MKHAKLTAAGIVFGVFSLGAASGSGITYYLTERSLAEPGDPGARGGMERHLRAMERVLDLSAQQKEQIRAVLQNAGADRDRRMRTVMNRCGQPLKDHKAKVDAEIRTLLTEEQRPRFDQLAAEQSRRFFSPGTEEPTPR